MGLVKGFKPLYSFPSPFLLGDLVNANPVFHIKMLLSIVATPSTHNTDSPTIPGPFIKMGVFIVNTYNSYC